MPTEIDMIGQMVQDGMKSPEVWGIIFLITLVVGFLALTYYRKKEMVQNAHLI